MMSCPFHPLLNCKYLYRWKEMERLIQCKSCLCLKYRAMKVKTHGFLTWTLHGGSYFMCDIFRQTQYVNELVWTWQ